MLRPRHPDPSSIGHAASPPPRQRDRSRTRPDRLRRLANRGQSRSFCRAGRRHDAPGAGGDAAEVLEEIRRRLAVGPEHDELVAEAVEDARAGRRPRW
jgi:hypothetical protein